MKLTKDGKVTVRNADSMADFVSYIGKLPVADRLVSDRTGDESSVWAGSPDLDTALTQVHSWTKGAAMIDRVKTTIKVKGLKGRNVAAFSPVGPGALNMGSFNSGHPAPYVVLKPTNQIKNGKGKIVNMIVNICASNGIDTEDITRRGASILALVEILEAQGRRVNLTLLAGFGSRSLAPGVCGLEYRINVKRAQDRLNLTSLAFGFAHPSMLRRLMFAAMEMESQVIRDDYRVGFSYGQPANTANTTGFDISLGCMHYNDPNISMWSTVEGCRKWIQQEAAKLGVTIV